MMVACRMAAKIPLALLLVLFAAVLRLWDVSSIPFTHDEYSALYRLRFEDFSELIRKGIMTDAHPALVQLFLYGYTSIFGQTEWVVKLPFILMGIASVGMIYQLGKLWYNSTCGAISASVFSFLQTAVLYSQIARPYSSGLFFVLGCMLTWEYYRRTGKRLYLILMAAAMLLSAINHYFSLLEVSLFGVYAFFLIPSAQRRNYVLAVAVAVVAFLPHLPITLAQLSLGGIGDVLAPPDSGFLQNYLKLVFHHSWIIIITLVLAAICSWLYRAPYSAQQAKNVFLALFLFFSPIIIGALYSLLRAPVLMERSLYFSLPFLLFFMFGPIREISGRSRFYLAGLLCLIGTISLISERQHYRLTYQSGFDGVLKSAWEAHNQGAEVWISGFKPFLNYSAAKIGIDSTFYHHLAASCDHRCFEQIIDTTQSRMLGIGRTQQLFVPDPTYDAAALEHFPIQLYQNNYLNADFRLYSSQGSDLPGYRIFRNNMPDGKYFQMDASRFDGAAFGFNQNDEFGLGFDIPYSKELFPHPNGEIAFTADIVSPQGLDGIELVLAISNNDSIVFYRSDKAINTTTTTLCAGLRLCDFSGEPETSSIKGYIWNRTKRNFSVQDFECIILQGNPLQYGISEPIYQKE
jgi:hypothetical protein